MNIDENINNRIKYVEMKQELEDSRKKFIKDAISMQNEYHLNQRRLTDLVHLIEFSDRLSVNDKMELYELYSNALKTRRKIKDFITLSVKQDARKAFFSNPSVRYGKDDILDSDIEVSNSDRMYTLKSGDENIVNFINSLKFKDKKYPNAESKVSETDLEELKNKFN